MEDNDPTDRALATARALLAARQPDAAEGVCADIVARDPRNAPAWFLLGVAQAEQGRIPDAKASLDRSFGLEPFQAAGHHLVRANVLLDAGEPAVAEGEARLALRDAPDSAAAHATLAFALLRQARARESIDAARSALARDPTHVRAHSALAAALSHAGRHAEAVAALRSALERAAGNPALLRQLAQAHWRAGRALHDEARLFGAMDEYRRALALDDSDAGWWNDLGNACASAGLLDEARQAYREALQRDPGFHQVESNLLIHLHYDPAFDAQALYAAHRAWAARHAAGFAAAAPRSPLRLAAGGRLRVGFLSPAFHAGPTAAFLAPLLQHLDRRRFETHAYQVDGKSDETTAALRERCDAWNDLRGQDDEAIAGRIRADGIHVLVDLAGHTPGGRLLVLARKPAPVIATWLDYFDTTGLDAVDYLIGDPVSIPEGAAQRFSERVARIAPSRLCYAPPRRSPDVAAAPVLRNGCVTFGSFNRVSKLAPPVIELWARVLAAVPASRLLLKDGALADAGVREHLAARFVRRGTDAGRLEMRGRSPHADMLREYGDVDIALDPFPWNGGLTTCEALWMGVPVLTLAGDSMISRQGASLLAAAGLPEWIAGSEEEYVRLAVERACDAAALATLREGLRARLSASPLLDGAAFARRFGQALLEMASIET